MKRELITTIFATVLGVFLVLVIVHAINGCETAEQTENTNCNCKCCMESEAEE